MSKIPGPSLRMESWARCLRGFIFTCSKGNCFFNFLFDVFWNSINLAYVSEIGEKDLVYNYLFTSQRESHSIPDMNYLAILSIILSHLEFLRIELPKLTLRILMKIVAVPVFLVDQFYSYMHQSIKALLFEKAKFTILISWPPIFIPLILLSALLKLAST